MKKEIDKKELMLKDFTESKKLELYYEILESLSEIKENEKWLLLISVAIEILDNGLDTGLFVTNSLENIKNILEYHKEIVNGKLMAVYGRKNTKELREGGDKLKELQKRDKLQGYGLNHKDAVLGIFNDGDRVIGYLANPNGKELYKEMSFLIDGIYSLNDLSIWINNVKEDAKLNGYNVVKVFDRRDKNHRLEKEVSLASYGDFLM